MVTLYKPEFTINNGLINPVMFMHKLCCKKTAGPFKKDVTTDCYIAKYDNNRFGVFSTAWGHHNIYKVFTEQELHDTFDEV